MVYIFTKIHELNPHIFIDTKKIWNRKPNSEFTKTGITFAYGLRLMRLLHSHGGNSKANKKKTTRLWSLTIFDLKKVCFHHLFALEVRAPVFMIFIKI